MSSAQARISRLLLCSSDNVKLEPLRVRFRVAGIEVDCATRAEQARDLMWQQHYDGVAVDLLLSDRDGISFALELRREHPWLSILVVSTTQCARRLESGPSWLTRSSEYARMIFALKQAGQRSAGRAPKILHVEDDDNLASLVRNTIGKQTQLFRARSAQEARIAMALRDYDLALMRTQIPVAEEMVSGAVVGSSPLYVHAAHGDPVLTILNNLRRSPFVHQPAYC
jgi:DNA-binding NtrC family response regulator